MWDKMSPEERQQMIEQLRDLEDQKQQGDMPNPSDSTAERDSSGGNGSQAGDEPRDARQGPPRRMNDVTSEDVDLRGDELAQQPIMQWLNRNAPDPSGRANTGDSTGQVRQAQAVAERAVEESAVQKRYHKMIKRYFGRLNQTIDRASGPEVAPATQPGR
jgi:hypothetical protein